MKKMIYLMLLLMVLSAASVNAQVRIGGTENPATGAVLDLNKDDGTNDKGLLLPKVALESTIDNTTVGPHTSGMVVYNTATDGDVTPGFYYNNGSAWVRMGGAASIAADAVDSTNIKNGTVGLEDIRDNIISSDKIMDGSIEPEDLSNMGANSGQVLVWDGSAWHPSFVAIPIPVTVTCTFGANSSIGSLSGTITTDCNSIEVTAAHAAHQGPFMLGIATPSNGRCERTCENCIAYVRTWTSFCFAK